MNTVELKERYATLYAAMAASRDTSKMKLFGTAFTQMFDRVADLKPDIAIATLELLSAIEYNNFVTPVEATGVAEKFINDDTLITGSAEPTRGAHWNMDALKGFLTQRGIALEEKPYYNWLPFGLRSI